MAITNTASAILEGASAVSPNPTSTEETMNPTPAGAPKTQWDDQGNPFWISPDGSTHHGIAPFDEEAEAIWAERNAGSGGGGGDATIDPPPGGEPGIGDTVDELLEGYESPMTLEDIRDAEAKARAARRAAANALFDPKIAEAQRLGERQKGSARGQFGVTRGLGLSTAEMGYMNNLQKDIDSRVKDIEQQKEQYIAAGDFAAAERADQQILQMQTAQNNLILKKAELAMKLGQMEQSQEQFEMTFGLQQQQEERLKMTAMYNIWGAQADIMGKIPFGETRTFTDPFTGEQIEFEGLDVANADPFFKGSDIISLMKALPEGQTETITDPNTGMEFEITGLKTEKPNVKAIQSTDDRGNVMITSYDTVTGQIINQVSAGKIGKTKTRAPSVTLMMNDQQKSDLSNAVTILESGIGSDGKYNSFEVERQFREYSILHPGKGNQFLEAIKGNVNYNDPTIKELYDRKSEEEDTISVTTPGGTTIEF